MIFSLSRKIEIQKLLGGKSMNSQMNTAMKAVGMSLAVGGAVAMVGSAMKGNSTKRKAKKAAKKAVNTFTNLVDNMQYMMK